MLLALLLSWFSSVLLVLLGLNCFSIALESLVILVFLYRLAIYIIKELIPNKFEFCR